MKKYVKENAKYVPPQALVILGQKSLSEIAVSCEPLIDKAFFRLLRLDIQHVSSC